MDLSHFAAVDAGEFLAQMADPFLDDSTVDFDLPFSGASGSDASDFSGAGSAGGSGDSFEVAPHAAQSGGGVFQLSEFDLNAGLVCARAGGEDIENEFAAIDDFALDGFFDASDLGGCEVAVEDYHVGAVVADSLGGFVDFSLADHVEGVNFVAFLKHVVHNEGAGRFREGA